MNKPYITGNTIICEHHLSEAIYKYLYNIINREGTVLTNHDTHEADELMELMMNKKLVIIKEDHDFEDLPF